MERLWEVMEPYSARIIDAAITFVIGIIAFKVILFLIRRWLKRGPLDEALHVFIVNVVKILLWVILIIAVMGTADIIEPTSMVAVLGALGAAFALAFKDTLSNFAGGISILFHQPFSKGDVIDDLNVVGIVDHIDLFYTTIMTYDNKVVTIPNGQLANNTVINYTKLDIRRIDFSFGISYESDIAKAKKVMLEVCERNPLILSEPETFAGVGIQNESSIGLELKCWCKTEDYWDVKYFIEENIKTAFDENGIIIPYRQVEIRILKEN